MSNVFLKIALVVIFLAGLLALCGLNKLVALGLFAVFGPAGFVIALVWAVVTGYFYGYYVIRGLIKLYRYVTA